MLVQVLSPIQHCFHLMERVFYALIWGIMHLKQYFHQRPFLLQMDHKPLEWLANVLNAYGQRGRWIVMLQDFKLKFVHCSSNRHLNVHALNKTFVKFSKDDEDFGSNVMESKDKLGGT